MKQFLLATAMLLLVTATAYADGGAMLLHQDSGPFTVTLFAAPQPLRTGMVDISVLVQDRASSQALLDPAVDVTLDQESAVRLAPAVSGNKLMQSAVVHFARAGQHRLGVVVRRGNDVAQLATVCQVEPDRSRTLLVLFYVLLPVFVVVLFVIQQRLKMRHSK
jgi:hypothetical protein